MNYMDFRKKNHDDKIVFLNEINIDENFFMELYYYSHHDKIYKIEDDLFFFRNVSIKEIKPFIEKHIFLFEKLKHEEHHIISFYCLIQSLLCQDCEDENLKERFTGYLKEKYFSLLNNEKQVYNVKIRNEEYEEAIFDLKENIEYNKARRDVTFDEIENCYHISIGQTKYSGSNLPHNNILNINSHILSPNQREYFNHYISSENLYLHIIENKEILKSKIFNYSIDNENKFNFISNSKLEILKESILSLKNENFYASLATIVPLIEDVFRNIIFDDFLNIVWEKYNNKKNYSEDNFILKSPPTLGVFFKKILKYDDLDFPEYLRDNYNFLDYNIIINFEFLLKSKYGLYIRNSLAHGCLGYNDLDYEAISSYLIYLTLCLCYY